MEKKIKMLVGDKVVRIHGHYREMYPGDTDIITAINPTLFNTMNLSLLKYGEGHSMRKFSVVKTNWREKLKNANLK